MNEQVLKPTVKVTVGEGDTAEEFVFRVPTPMERVRLGVREAAIRRSFDPSSSADASALDAETYFMIKGMAVLEGLLEKSSQRWPFTEVKNAKGDPELVVDITKFPVGKDDVIGRVGLQFDAALDRFHRDGSGDGQPAVSEAVDGVGNPGAF